jgi:hypothetical protein
LLGRGSTTSATSSALFVLVIFEIGSPILPVCAFQVAGDDRYTPLYLATG